MYSAFTVSPTLGEAEKMEQTNNSAIPRPPSTDNSVWTVEGSQHALANINNTKDGAKSIFPRATRKRLETLLIFAIVIISILVLALCVTIYLVADTTILSPNVCYSKKCMRSASQLLLSLNETADPCDNFFNYVCGKWNIENPGPEPYVSSNWFVVREIVGRKKIKEYLTKENTEDEPVAVHKARLVYEACLDFDSMEENGFNTYWEILKDIGLPKNPLDDSEPKVNWLRALAKFMRYIGTQLIIGASVASSLKNSTVNQLVLSSPTEPSVLSHKHLRFNWDSDLSAKVKSEMKNGEEDAIKKIWETHVLKMVQYVIKAGGAEVNETDLKEALFNVLELTRNFSEFENSVNISKTVLSEIPEEISFSSMQMYLDEATTSKKSKINLKEYFDALYEDIPDVNIEYDVDNLLVYQKYYFKLMSSFLENADDKVIGMYIWWNVLYTIAPHVTEELVNLNEMLTYKIVGEIPRETRSQTCARTLTTLMTPAVGYYLLSNINNETINQVETLIENIRSVFASHIKGLSWMDQATKDSSLEKLKSIRTFIGIPQIMYDREEMDVIYNMTFDDTEHLRNLLDLLDDQIGESFGSLRIPNNFSEMNFDPVNINAYYDPSSNSITVPYGILQFPFHDLGIEALNYGAIGTILGHEMTHGFDNTGRRYDKDGNVFPWWSNHSTEQYVNRTHCFEEEYDKFQIIPTYNLTVDGTLTLDENLADDGGIKFAFNAYKAYVKERGVEPKLPGLQKYAHDQLFFMSYAHIWCSEYSDDVIIRSMDDEHSPEYARVVIVLQNFPEFSETWNCPKGSKMNPAKKCKMWS